MQDGYGAINVGLPINFTSLAINSKIFKDMPSSYASQVYSVLNTESVTLNDHNGGFNPNQFINDEYLSGNFSILGNSIYNNKTFVTFVETKENLGLNWFGVQYHPEKPQYEFTRNGIPHNLDSIFSNQYMASFFVNQCRVNNDNVMNEDLLNNIVIYNYKPYFVDKYNNASFEVNYLFS